MTSNQGIRQLMKESRIYNWEIANYLKVSEPTLYRWLRQPLDAEKAGRIQKAIDELTKQNVD